MCNKSMYEIRDECSTRQLIFNLPSIPQSNEFWLRADTLQIILFGVASHDLNPSSALF